MLVASRAVSFGLCFETEMGGRVAGHPSTHDPPVGGEVRTAEGHAGCAGTIESRPLCCDPFFALALILSVPSDSPWSWSWSWFWSWSSSLFPPPPLFRGEVERVGWMGPVPLTLSLSLSLRLTLTLRLDWNWNWNE